LEIKHCWHVNQIGLSIDDEETPEEYMQVYNFNQKGASFLDVVNDILKHIQP
jgi:hypothetical protein